jgi:hypothetical protein
MGDRLQVQDAFDIDDSRAMDADKTNGIEPLGKLVQRRRYNSSFPPTCRFA